MPMELSRCAIHTMTHKPWTLAQCCDKFAAAGVAGISVWRNVLEPIHLDEAARIVRGSGLQVPALVRGGFFVSTDANKRRAAIDENKRCIDEAAALGAEMVVLVVGAQPGLPLADARQQVCDGIAACLDHAHASNVKLAIEPLHPIYAADRSCINRMAEARAICQTLQHPMLGIALDVYHVWWDPDLESEIEMAGKQGTLLALHVCDWRQVLRDPLNDRGLMGDGCIDIRAIRRLVENTGFRGLIEVEVFSDQYWAMDQDEYLKLVCQRFADCV